MTILQLPVPEATAQRFEQLSPQQQTLVSQLVSDCLTEPASLAGVMDYISFRAAQRGIEAETILKSERC